MIDVYFENRDFTPYNHKHWEKLQVINYSKNAMGGCKRARIQATGAENDLWEFIEMLRCPVYIRDEPRAKRIWWGYINSVTIPAGNYLLTVSLDDMANRIAVAYSYQNERFTTAWAQNTQSDAEYGQKDLLLTAREKSSTMAAQFRATELAARQFPVWKAPRPHQQRNRPAVVTLDCLGWMESLDWQYYANDEGNEEYTDFGSGAREVGEDDRPKCAQGFQISSAGGWTATAIWLHIWKVGSPVDNFQVALWSDSGGSGPLAEIETCAVLAGANISNNADWYEFVLDSEQALALATQYWIHCSRSGGVDASNYYMVDANKDQGYANGNLWIQRSSDSSWYDKNMDALFRVVGEQATTSQISDIVSTAGEFFVGTTIEDASGVTSTQYRPGDQRALYEILELLKAGTTNSLRLLAEVDQFRNLRVFEEPARYSADYTLSGEDEIRDDNGTLVPPQECPVGIWIKLKDFIPSTANISKLSDPSPIFVEEAEYDVQREEYRILKSRSSVSAAASLAQGIGIG